MKGKIVEKLADVNGVVSFYRKKPVKIRAVELKEKVWIKTREGELAGEVGDFLIEGIKGEIYPCGREIFFQTYDKVKAEEKEEVVLGQIVKKDGIITMKHSKSASVYEIFGFLAVYLEALEMDLISGFEATDEFELF